NAPRPRSATKALGRRDDNDQYSGGGARQGIIRRQGAARTAAGAFDRLLLARLPRRRRRASRRRQDLASDAAIAQPQLGSSGTDPIPRAFLGQVAADRGLAGHHGPRSVATARRTDVDRPRLASGPPR